MDKIDLSDFFITKSQANDFTVKLSNIIDMMYTANFNLEKAIALQFGIQKTDSFLKLLRENNINTSSIEALQDFLKKVQDTVTNLTVVSLVIAFEPSDETLKTFSQWFVFNVNKQILFDIHIDPKIIAGAKITYNGKFKDYSLGPRFETMIHQMLYPNNSQVPSQPLQHATGISTHQDTQHITLGR